MRHLGIVIFLFMAGNVLPAAESLQDSAQGVEMAGPSSGGPAISRPPVASRYILESEWQEQKRRAAAVAEESTQVPTGSMKTTTLPGVPGWFHFGAFVDTTANYTRKGEPTPTDPDNMKDRFDFEAEFKMLVDVHLPQDVMLHTLLAFRDGPQNQSGDSEAELEEAYVAYDPGDWLATKIGRFRRWFGWERFDAPDLWRVSSSFTHYNTGSMDGVGAYFSPERPFTVGLFVVDEIISPDDPADTKDGGDFGYGVSFRVSTEENILYKLDAYYDVNTARSLTDADGKGSVFGVSFHGNHDRFMDSPISIGFVIGTAINPDSYQIAAIGTLRWDYMVSESVPGFSSIWVAGFWEDYTQQALNIADANGIDLLDNHRLEATIVTFFYPVTSTRFRVGAEVSYVASQIGEEDAFGFYLQMVFSLTEPRVNRLNPLGSGYVWPDEASTATGAEAPANGAAAPEPVEPKQPEAPTEPNAAKPAAPTAEAPASADVKDADQSAGANSEAAQQP